MEILNARVIQKIATVQEWESSTLLPYKGEIMLVAGSDGSVFNIKVGDGVNKFPELDYIFEASEFIYDKFAPGSSLPNPGRKASLFLGAGTYSVPGGGASLVLTEKLNVVSWDGGKWVKVLEIPIVVPPAENKIPDWTAGNYTLGKQRIQNGQIWEVVVASTNREPGTETGTKPTWHWQPKTGGGAGEEVIGEDLFNLATPSGQLLISVDSKGFLWAKFKDGFFKIESIDGLKEQLSLLGETAITEFRGDNQLEIQDAGGNLLGSIDKNGTFNLIKLRVGDLEVYGDQNEPSGIVTGEEVVLPELGFFNVFVEGQPAWDFSNKTPVFNRATLCTGDGKELVKFNIAMEIQGGSSAGGHIKKGYTFDLLNAEMDGVELKIGRMVSTDSYHLKGFWGDTTHVRDTGNGRLWWDMAQSRPFPDNFVRLMPLGVETKNNKKASYVEDATFSSNGIPCAMYMNGQFFGLYTWRLKKEKLNYAVDDKNENNIFIDSQVVGAGLGAKAYADFDEIAVDYEFRSPDDLTDLTKANTERFFSYMRRVYTNQENFRDNYNDYMVFSAWVDFVIICELIWHWDSVSNNAAYITYDGLRWWPVLADTDNTIGLNAAQAIDDTRTTLVLANRDVFKNFMVEFLPEIKARYTELRNNGTLTNANFKKIYGGISENIPYYVYVNDFNKWGSWSNQLPTMRQLYTFLNARLGYLDGLWLNP